MVGALNTEGGWAFLFEWPYCSTCAEFTWEHTHATDAEGPKYPQTRDAELLATLGLSGRPSLADVKSAYRKMMKVHHPDKGGNEATAKMLIAAYDELRARGLAP